MEEKIVINNEDYNYLRKRMRRLEETYKQSEDPNIRNAVKMTTLEEINKRLYDFKDLFGTDFEKCKMSSLVEIDNLEEKVMSNYKVKKLQEVTEKELKKQLKLKDKPLKAFLKGYNEAIKNEDLTYYAQRIDDKLVILSKTEDEFVGAVTNVIRSNKKSQHLCPFCNKFRHGDEVIFISNVKSNQQGEYSSIGQTICEDYKMCNKDIQSKEALNTFLSFKLDKGKSR